MAEMQNIMTTKVGIFRTGRVLQEAVHELQQLLLRSRNIGLRCKARSANPELVTAYRVRKMLKMALCIAYGAYCANRKPGCSLPRGLPAPQRRRVAEPHARHMEV